MILPVIQTPTQQESMRLLLLYNWSKKKQEQKYEAIQFL